MIIAVTGHRPKSLGGHSSEVGKKIYKTAVSCLEQLREKFDVSTVLTGMAQGWDIEVALACLDRGIPYAAYVPFLGQELFWPDNSQMRYRHLLDNAIKVEMCSKKSSGDLNRTEIGVLLMARNRCLVRDSQMLLALWNGRPRGGTYNCVTYAAGMKRPMVNAWPVWKGTGPIEEILASTLV